MYKIWWNPGEALWNKRISNYIDNEFEAYLPTWVRICLGERRIPRAADILNLNHILVELQRDLQPEIYQTKQQGEYLLFLKKINVVKAGKSV